MPVHALIPRLTRAAVVALATLLLSSCASDSGWSSAGLDLGRFRELNAFDTLMQRQDRVYRLIAPLLTKNTPLCDSAARPLLGFTAKNRYSYPMELRAAAESRLKLGGALQVVQVLDGSGAQRAGLRRGDVLLAIEGQALPQGAQAETEAARMMAPLMHGASRLSVRLSRGGRTKTFKVPLTPACAFSAEIGNAPHVNAYSDGRRIMLTAGMLDTLSDAEVTAILAREIAHGALGHARIMQMSSTLTGVIDALLPPRPDLTAFAGSAGIRPMEPGLDLEADRVALTMLARAGSDPALLLQTLARLAQTQPATVTSGYTALHPWTTERAAMMQTALSELRQKQPAGKPLLP